MRGPCNTIQNLVQNFKIPDHVSEQDFNKISDISDFFLKRFIVVVQDNEPL